MKSILCVAFFILSSIAPNRAIEINVGHVYFYVSEVPVMSMAYRDLKEQGIIPPAYDFIIHSRPGCALYVANLSLLHGVEEAIDLYFNENVDVFFGSPCSEETAVIGQMAAAANWNLPVLGYLSSDDSLSDKNVYNTLARTTVISATFFAQAVKMVLAQNGWKKVAYVGSNTLFNNLNRQAVVSALTPSGVDIFHMSTEANPTWQSIASNKAMTDLKANARVVLVMFGSEMNTSVPFMAAAHSLGYTADPDFVFIIFSLANNYQSRPWDADYNGVSYPYLRAAYEGAYIIRIAGLDFASVSTFRQKLLAAENYTNPVGNDASIMPMYDAVFLYGMALNKSLADTGNKSVFTNGAKLFQYMKNIEFTGVTSQVLINNDGERIPSYLFSRLPKNVSRIYTNLMVIEANRDDHCEPAIQGNLCYPYNITLTPDYLSITWPPDIPKCGYRYEKCDNTLFFTLGGVILASVIAVIVVYYIMKKRRESLLYLMPWRVSMESVKLLSSGTVVSSMISMTSLRDSSTSVNSKNVTTSLQQALVGNTRASVRRYKQLKRISFSRRDLNCLYYSKQATHDNLNTFVGLTYNNLSNECLFLWKLCTRGSLQDIVANEDLMLDMDFKASFINDIIKGMLFLHSSKIKEHGALRSSNCLVDNHWTVKLTDYGVNRTITDLLKHREIQYTEEGVQEPTPNKLLYMAPEHLRTFLSHRRIEVSQAGDIYAVGIIMHEILYRLEPYSDSEDTAEDIVQKVASLDATSMRAIRPPFPRDPYVHPETMLIIQQCWSESADQRPNIKRIKKVVEAVLRTSSGTITDHMIKMMEDYAGNLEKIVHERTAMLEETQLQAEGLLLQMLPKSVAQDLKLGRHVAPQTYEEATVLFSDIAGFTTLCSSSGPLEIVAFLNGIFSGFDAIIAEHSAYKVETIGDAYMMVSGVPEVIGGRHVEEIASIALSMNEFVKNFKVAHRPGMTLQIRTGFHSGPVASGVVGLSAPRYCLFGDTVNMASRMESNSEIGRIQMSATSYQLLFSRRMDDFFMEERGHVEIKGKGKQLTYWLLGRNDDVIRATSVKKSQYTQNRAIGPKRIKQNFMA